MRNILRYCGVFTCLLSEICFLCISTVMVTVFSNNVYAAGCPARATSIGTVNFGTLTVSSSIPVGGLIDTRTVSAGSKPNILNINGEFSHNLTKFTTLSSLGESIYDTNIQGVGIKVTHVANGVFPYSDIYTGQGLIQPSSYLVELYKTASSVQSGTITSGQIATVACNSTIYNAINLSAVNVVNTACTVNTSSLTVPLGTVYASEFNTGTVGTTSHETSFSIPLNCPSAGVSVKMQLDGDTVSGFSTALALSDNGTNGVADGYGVQVLTGSSPIIIGTPTQVATTTSGQVDVQLKARYIKTQTISNSGRADSTATFTLTYE
ncbi:putative major fimbrial protein SthE [Morganella morganii]|nr:putative major fimbrial protein SthE [Morganella morganii]